MGSKSWQELATKAKDIARRIVNGDEENKNGERLIHIVYRLDTFATNALNKKFAQSGSIGSVHTYAGGTQVISTRHADGSEGSFNTDGECTPTDNPMDIEVDAYINGGNGGGGGQSSPAAAMVLPESKTNKKMKKNVIKLNEDTLRQIVAESVEKVLKEQNTLLKNGYEVLNLVQAYQDDDSEQYIAMLKNMSEGCKKQVKEITGVTVDEMLSHWYAFHKAMIAIKKRYSELLTTGNNDGGYYDWH